jgi:CheY-like chemotaxis protein
MGRESRTDLVVDGSASSLFSMVMLLRRLEYRVLTARSGRDALQALEKTLPAVVVTDSVLPDMDGAAFLKATKGDERLRPVPVVVLMSREDPSLKAACSRIGCSACLPKACDPAELYRTIQSLSESSPRQHIRLAASVRVIVGDGTALGGSERVEQATAISEGGLYVRTRYPQPQNAVTPLRILLDEQEVRAKAVVIYSSQDGMGMKFIRIADDDRDLLRRFIKARLTKDIAH